MITLKSPLRPVSLNKLGPVRIHRRNSNDSGSVISDCSMFSIKPSEPAVSASVFTMDKDASNDVDESVVQNSDASPTTLPSVTASKKASGSSQTELTINTPSAAEFVNSMPRSDDDAPQSVIHAPTGFGEFVGKIESDSVDHQNGELSSSIDEDTDIQDAVKQEGSDKEATNSALSPSPLATTIPPPLKELSDIATPRAQTRQEIESLSRPTHSSNLEDIPENTDTDPHITSGSSTSPVALATETTDTPRKQLSPSNTVQIQDQTDETAALWTALDECWTFCNTLANLSSIHRERLFNAASKGDMQELAWKSCWKLCRKLYEGREDDYALQIDPTLGLCRDFCQALFEVRARENEDADSVLRVSFELNNHLYNASDHSLPPAFRERTLDFYITLCHRLMKQRMHLEEETDSLLHACWSLAEMLFSIRQSKREGKSPDEELLGSAIQACWELCDLFREGWTQIRPDRGTPRPSQISFSEALQSAKGSSVVVAEEGGNPQTHPETPTTIFEDTATVSPDEAPVPNILVLGQGNQNKWSSGSSTLSGRSRTSEHTSSTNTVVTSAEDMNILRLKILITKAAIDTGYLKGGSQTLSSFTKSLSSDSFGPSSWQVSLLEQYKKLVTTDPTFKMTVEPGHAGAVDVARAVQSMLQSGQYMWLRDLYRLVFGFHIEEAVNRRNVTIQT